MSSVVLKNMYHKLYIGQIEAAPPAERRCLEGLIRAGVFVRDGGIVRPDPDMFESTLELFSSLLSRYLPQLRPMEMEGCPIRFCTGLVSAPSGSGFADQNVGAWLPAGGQGQNAVAAATSCLGEMAERLSLYRDLDADDPRTFKVRDGVPDLPAGPVFGFSAGQEAQMLRRYFPGFETAEERVDWNRLAPERIRLRNLITGSAAQLPAYGVLLKPLTTEGMPDFGSTAGAAVYSSFEEAVERATWELVERDAFARAWYNRLWINRVPEDWSAQNLCKSMTAFLSKRARRTCLFQIGTDLSAHVALAISFGEGGYGGALGVAAAGSFAVAARSAVSEMLQSEQAQAWTVWAADRAQARGEPATLSAAVRYGRATSIVEDLGLDAVPLADGAALEETFSFAALLESCDAAGVDLWVFDATHPQIKVPCAKVLSPQLCSWEQRFGKRRLYPEGVFDDPVQQPVWERAYALRPFPF